MFSFRSSSNLTGVSPIMKLNIMLSGVDVMFDSASSIHTQDPLQTHVKYSSQHQQEIQQG